MTMNPAGAGSAGVDVWDDAVLAAQLLAVDAAGVGGVRLRARAGPVRDRWLEIVRRLCPNQPMVRLPLHADADRLAGGLDLAATLRAGRPVGEQGLLHRANGGLLLVAMAERVDSDLAATIGMAMETGTIQGAVASNDDDAHSTRFGVIALDEGVDADEATPAGLADRLGLHLDLSAVTVRDLDEAKVDAAAVLRAREILADVRVGGSIVEALCAAALVLGIGSMRAPWLAVRAARALAALDGRVEVSEDDLGAAVRLVLVPRATTLPAGEDEAEQDQEPPPEDQQDPQDEEQEQEPPADEPPEQTPDPDNDSDDDDDHELDPEALESLVDRVLESVLASVPEGLLEESRKARAGGASRSSAGKAGAQQASGVRGRPAGVRRGRPGPNARLNLVETLRAAAPWQKLRASNDSASGPRVQVRPDDFRVNRFKQRKETTTVFVVDASGSSALHRLAEAKGAVELLLADCYVRRDSVALVTFRGTEAEVLLPPTRSLVQAKHRLAELPGGGGTPVASGLECALELGHSILRRGATPIIVVLTDGRANIAADGTPGRQQAQQDALAAAQRLRAAGLVTLLVDTSPRPRPLGEELAAAMGARYIPLPHADAERLSAAIKAETT